ncbi:hypothetical protein EV426DRAFT_409194 [Tirmania nivea]|nr:hypothetical protein EV426DRAFT_409194 [Tirmania nivea]
MWRGGATLSIALGQHFWIQLHLVLSYTAVQQRMVVLLNPRILSLLGNNQINDSVLFYVADGGEVLLDPRMLSFLRQQSVRG